MRVVVTRPAESAARLVKALEAGGLDVILFPVLEIVPTPEEGLTKALVRLRSGAYDWLVFTSANGVRVFGQTLRTASVQGEEGIGAATRIAAVGPATRAAVEALGLQVDLMPHRHTAEDLLTAFERGQMIRGRRFLLTLAEGAGEHLPAGLAALGGDVDVVESYRSVVAEAARVEAMKARILEAGVDIVTFASPSAAKGFLELLGRTALEVPAVVIGPVTREAAERLGYRVVAAAEPHTSEGLARAAIDWAAGG